MVGIGNCNLIHWVNVFQQQQHLLGLCFFLQFVSYICLSPFRKSLWSSVNDALVMLRFSFHRLQKQKESSTGSKIKTTIYKFFHERHHCLVIYYECSFFRAKFGITEMCRDLWNWASKHPYGYAASESPKLNGTSRWAAPDCSMWTLTCTCDVVPNRIYVDHLVSHTEKSSIGLGKNAILFLPSISASKWIFHMRIDCQTCYSQSANSILLLLIELCCLWQSMI